VVATLWTAIVGVPILTMWTKTLEAAILVLVVVAYLIARWLGVSRSARRQGPLQRAVPAR
jgi:hypothetical protein